MIHVNPVALPDGRTVLFSCMTGVQGSERIEAVSLESGARRVILERAMGPAWSPTGHLLFSRDGAVLAAPADAATGSIRGPAVTVIPAGTVGLQGSGTPGYRLSSNGTLLFLPAESFSKRLVTVSRDGAARALDLPASRYSNPRVSPDGARLLVEGGGTVIEALDTGSWRRARQSRRPPWPRPSPPGRPTASGSSCGGSTRRPGWPPTAARAKAFRRTSSLTTIRQGLGQTRIRS